MKKKIIFCAFLLFSQNFLLSGQQKIVIKTVKITTTIVSNVHLFLAGNFNNWNPADTAWELLPNGTGQYLLVKEMPKGNYTFKVTKGNWQSVECTDLGKPIANRTLTVLHDTTLTLNIAGWQDDFNIPEKIHTASRQVHVVSNNFEIPQLNRQRRIWIYLPAGYALSKRKYPVIYMQDGQNLFDACTSGFGEWGVDEMLDKLPAKNECIIIGIDHGGQNRITEYDPYDSEYGKGRGNDFVDFIAKTLKPYIDAHYRTLTDARHSAIAGSSMGGLIAMYAALKYPETFGNAGIFSPSFWIAPEIYRYARQQQLPPGSRFYFVCGDAESGSMVTDMKKMADIMRANGKNNDKTPVVIIKGASHNEKQWNGDFPAFYSWLLKKF